MATGNISVIPNLVAALENIQTITSGSINDLTDGGVYFLSGVSNCPSGTYGFCITLVAEHPYLRQIFMRSGTPGTNDGNIYTRTASSKSSSAWGSWWKFTGEYVS